LLSENSEAYPDVFILLRIIMTLPVRTASAQKSFFVGEIVKDFSPSNSGAGAVDRIGSSFSR
jgi:hypothetical protein